MIQSTKGYKVLNITIHEMLQSNCFKYNKYSSVPNKELHYLEVLIARVLNLTNYSMLEGVKIN